MVALLTAIAGWLLLAAADRFFFLFFQKGCKGRKKSKFGNILVKIK